jgi:hypothetical protein
MVIAGGRSLRLRFFSVKPSDPKTDLHLLEKDEEVKELIEERRIVDWRYFT